MRKTLSSVELEKGDKRQHSLAVSYCSDGTSNLGKGVGFFLVHVFNMPIKRTTSTARENLEGFHSLQPSIMSCWEPAGVHRIQSEESKRSRKTKKRSFDATATVRTYCFLQPTEISSADADSTRTPPVSNALLTIIKVMNCMLLRFRHATKYCMLSLPPYSGGSLWTCQPSRIVGEWGGRAE